MLEARDVTRNSMEKVQWSYRAYIPVAGHKNYKKTSDQLVLCSRENKNVDDVVEKIQLSQADSTKKPINEWLQART